MITNNNVTISIHTPAPEQTPLKPSLWRGRSITHLVSWKTVAVLATISLILFKGSQFYHPESNSIPAQLTNPSPLSSFAEEDPYGLTERVEQEANIPLINKTYSASHAEKLKILEESVRLSDDPYGPVYSVNANLDP